jgi:indolepyruvate ferredoxin oxidoreductase beta subunit
MIAYRENRDDRKNCLITGVGGQGTVLLSRLIGNAALEQGLAVRGTETIGMAQRGGSVVSHIRIGTGIHAPLIPLHQGDLIIAFECAEAVRVLPFLAAKGQMLVLNRPVPPVSSALGVYRYDPGALMHYLKEQVQQLTLIDGERLINQCGNPRVVNVALLGVALTLKCLPFTPEDIIRVITKQVPPRFLDLNLKALQIGLHLRWVE